MRPTTEQLYNKFLYVVKNPTKIKLLYAYGIVSWTLLIFSYIRFLNLSPIYWVVFGPVLATISVYNYLNYGINLFYKPFDVAAHNKFRDRFWKKFAHKKPSIDVFLPVCGEDLRILDTTFAAVDRLEYRNKKIYVLDDKGQATVKKLARSYGFIYLSRPNKQYMKKAGNLLYGFKHSHGEFYIVFDADFAPAPDFITELLPYMNDKKVGIVQSPQYFEVNNEIHQRSPIEYGAANLQEDFYRIIQRSRDTFGGAICVGSNAIYRRAALEKIGGPTQIDHGEDVYTGVDVLSAGYQLKYIPLILARGYCPDTLQAFYKQHNRWCSSSVGMFLSGKVLKAPISVAQKLCYYTGFLYYICQLFYFLLPLQLFVLLGLHTDTISLFNALPFLPYIVFGVILIPLSRISKPKMGTYLANMSCIYTDSLTVVLRLFGKAANWVPTNTVEHGIEKGFEVLNNFSQIFLAVYIAVVAALILTWRLPLLNWTFYSVIFWVLWNIVLHGLYLFSTYKVIYQKKAKDALRRASYARSFTMWKIRTLSTFAVGVLLIVGSLSLSLKNTHGQVLYATRSAILAQLKAQQTTKIAATGAQTDDTHSKVLGVATVSGEVATASGETTPKVYSETITQGDSFQTLAQRALVEYEKDQAAVKLDYAESQYVVNYVAQNHQATDKLIGGNQVIFTFDEVNAVAQNSKQMSAVERSWWASSVPVASN